MSGAGCPAASAALRLADVSLFRAELESNHRAQLVGKHRLDEQVEVVLERFLVVAGHAAAGDDDRRQGGAKSRAQGGDRGDAGLARVEPIVDDDERGLDERGVNISGGERQSLAIARAMFFGSSLLVLDEPTSALAVRQAGRVLDHIVQARDRGQAVVLITHNFRHALSVADDLTVLAQGRVAAHFRRDEVELDELTDLVARVS